MKTIELWKWWLTGPTGKRHKSRHLMTAADALLTDPTAQRVEDSREIRQVPGTDAERLQLLPQTEGTGPKENK